MVVFHYAHHEISRNTKTQRYHLTNGGSHAGHSIGDGKHGGQLRSIDLKMRGDWTLEIDILLPETGQFFGFGNRC